MRRALVPTLLVVGLLAPAAQASVPFTVGEGRAPHLMIGAADTAHVVWHDETRKVFHCRLPRGSAACEPLNTVDVRTDADRTFVLAGSDGALYLLMPHYVDQRTYLWKSTDDGRTWRARTTIHGWGGGTGSSEPVLGPQPGQVTFASANSQATLQPPAWSAALDGSKAGMSTHTTLDPAVAYDTQVAPTKDGGLVVVGHSLDTNTASFQRMAPGGDPSDQAAWSARAQLGIGDTTRVAGGTSGTYMLSTVAPTDAHMDLRAWNGTAFRKPLAIDETGYVNDVHVGPSGAVAAIWRLNNPNGNRLRLALSTNGGTSYRTTTIAIEDSLMTDMDVALAPDTIGLAAFEGGDGTNGTRKLIRVVNTLPVDDAVSPNPPSILRRTRKVPGARLRLDVPGNCLELDSSFSAFLSAKRRGGRRSRFARIARADFFLGAVRLKRDRRKPFDVTVPTDDLDAKRKYTVRAAVTVRLKGGGTATTSISAPVQAC